MDRQRSGLRSKAGDNYNAIDPNLIPRPKGRRMARFGSFWDGIKMWRLDDSGMLSKKDNDALLRSPAAAQAGN